RLFVRDERHRRDGVRLMTRLALVLKNRRDVLRERDGRSRQRVRRVDGRSHGKHGTEADQTNKRSHSRSFNCCSVRPKPDVRLKADTTYYRAAQVTWLERSCLREPTPSASRAPR